MSRKLLSRELADGESNSLKKWFKKDGKHVRKIHKQIDTVGNQLVKAGKVCPYTESRKTISRH